MSKIILADEPPLGLQSKAVGYSGLFLSSVRASHNLRGRMAVGSGCWSLDSATRVLAKSKLVVLVAEPLSGLLQLFWFEKVPEFLVGEKLGFDSEIQPLSQIKRFETFRYLRCVE